MGSDIMRAIGSEGEGSGERFTHIFRQFAGRNYLNCMIGL